MSSNSNSNNIEVLIRNGVKDLRDIKVLGQAMSQVPNIELTCRRKIRDKNNKIVAYGFTDKGNVSCLLSRDGVYQILKASMNGQLLHKVNGWYITNLQVDTLNRVVDREIKEDKPNKTASSVKEVKPIVNKTVIKSEEFTFDEASAYKLIEELGESALLNGIEICWEDDIDIAEADGSSKRYSMDENESILYFEDNRNSKELRALVNFCNKSVEQGIGQGVDCSLDAALDLGENSLREKGYVILWVRLGTDYDVNTTVKIACKQDKDSIEKGKKYLDCYRQEWLDAEIDEDLVTDNLDSAAISRRIGDGKVVPKADKVISILNDLAEKCLLGGYKYRPEYGDSLLDFINVPDNEYKVKLKDLEKFCNIYDIDCGINSMLFRGAELLLKKGYVGMTVYPERKFECPYTQASDYEYDCMHKAYIFYNPNNAKDVERAKRFISKYKSMYNRIALRAKCRCDVQFILELREKVYPTPSVLHELSDAVAFLDELEQPEMVSGYYMKAKDILSNCKKAGISKSDLAKMMLNPLYYEYWDRANKEEASGKDLTCVVKLDSNSYSRDKIAWNAIQ